ncbi:MAG: signal transduction histidine kinase [Halonotius sp. J07HN4]|nr:MAG: signal transduction histidine kinase [Halonotius sp. J07HN4]
MDTNERIDTLYELSLAITPEETLEATATTALTAYLEELSCSVGAVFARGEAGAYRVVGEAAVGTEDPVYAAGERRLRQWAASDEPSRKPLPITGTAADNGSYYLFELPEFGVLLLGHRGSPLDEAVQNGLEPLNEQLATACTTKQVKTTLSDTRRRFATLFTTITEPMVNVVVTETACEIGRTNDAFTETFGTATAPEAGVEPVEPIADSDDKLTTEIEERLRNGQPVTETVRRKTAAGTGEFLLRGVPVTTSVGQELFLLYVDITEERRQQRLLASLYERSEAILTSKDQATAGKRTVETAVSVLDGTVVEIHRYDRATDTLQPETTTAGEPVFSADGCEMLWDTYDGTPHQFNSEEMADESLRCGDDSVKSVLSLPLGDHGVIIVGHDRPDGFDEMALQLGQLLAAFGRIALTRTERAGSLEAIQSIMQEAVTADTVSAVGETVIDRLPTATNFPTAGIWAHDPAAEQLEPIATTGRATELIGEHPTFGPGNSIAWEAFSEGETRLVSDVRNHPEVYNEDSVIQSEVIAPIGEFGVLIPAAMRPQNISVADRKIAETLASSLETSIELIENRQELRLLETVIDRVLRHNLRTNLSIIRSRTAQIAADCETDGFTEQMLAHADKLEATAENARTMREVVQSRGQRRELSVADVIEDAIAAAPDPPAGVDLVVDTDTTATVIAHPKLSTAIAQLIENAIEHGVTDGGTIQLTATADDSQVTICVADNGSGIPKNELAVIDQAEESALNHASGVGLWLINRIAAYSDGDLSFEIDDGTIARLTLKRA